jgi:hypothetical protein
MGSRSRLNGGLKVALLLTTLFPSHAFSFDWLATFNNGTVKQFNDCIEVSRSQGYVGNARARCLSRLEQQKFDTNLKREVWLDAQDLNVKLTNDNRELVVTSFTLTANWVDSSNKKQSVTTDFHDVWLTYGTPRVFALAIVPLGAPRELSKIQILISEKVLRYQ